MNRKAYPYPEIVTGETWSVFETHPGQVPNTDNQNRQMYVPIDRKCIQCGVNHSRYIRRHELGHVKWSPKTIGKLKPGVRAEAVEVLEEIRINHLLHVNELGINEAVMCTEDIKLKAGKAIYESSLSEILLMLLSSMWKTNENLMSVEYQVMSDMIDDASKDTVFTELRRVELEWILSKSEYFYRQLTYKGKYRGRVADKISYRKVQRLAEELSLMLEEFHDRPEEKDVINEPTDTNKPITEPDQEPCDIESCEVEGCIDHDETLEDEDDSKITPESLEKRMRRNLIDEMQYQTTQGTGKWGDMEIIKPPLTVNLQGRLKNSRQYRPMDYGYNPKYINRYCIDKKIFKQKQRVLGGTVLIDSSGSMSFNGTDILELMEMLPAVTIAMYNGSGITGRLHIIAKNGMRVNEDYLEEWSGGGNVVDGPALTWLAGQSERRIWVSDMKVFGINRGGYSEAGFNLLKDVYRICTENKIINLLDIEEVKEHAIKLQNVV